MTRCIVTFSTQSCRSLVREQQTHQGSNLFPDKLLSFVAPIIVPTGAPDLLSSAKGPDEGLGKDL